MRALDDLNDPVTRQRLEFALKEMASETGGDVEKLIKELADQYI